MLDVLFIGAHPDDESCICGTLIKAVKAGKKVGILTLTKGESCGYATGEEREAEMEKAVAVIGADYFKHLDFLDSGLRFNDEMVAAIIDVLVETRPRTVITLYPVDCHPDHIAVSQSVDSALFLAHLKKHIGEARWDFMQVFYVSVNPAANSKDPDIIIDVTDVIDEKHEAANCHASQGVADSLIRLAGYYGEKSGFSYGEALYKGVTRQYPIKLKSFIPLLLED